MSERSQPTTAEIASQAMAAMNLSNGEWDRLPTMVKDFLLSHFRDADALIQDALEQEQRNHLNQDSWETLRAMVASHGYSPVLLAISDMLYNERDAEKADLFPIAGQVARAGIQLNRFAQGAEPGDEHHTRPPMVCYAEPSI